MFNRASVYFSLFLGGGSWKDNKRRRNKRLGSHSCSSYKPHKGYKDRKHHKVPKCHNWDHRNWPRRNCHTQM